MGDSDPTKPAPVGELSRGERLKLAAQALLAARRELYVLRGRRALLVALLDRGMATADDVRRAVELPEGIDPVCLGSVPGHLARAGIIRAAGYATSMRPEAHARPVQIWELANRPAAESWLCNNPDRPDGPEPAAPDPNPTGDYSSGYLFAVTTPAEGVAHV